MNKSLTTIASIKALRGSIALGIGSSLIFTYQNSKVPIFTEHPILKIISEKDPFLQQLTQYFLELSKEQILYIGLLTIALGILRWVEATGIWANRRWAQWIAVLTGFIYIPFEISVLASKFSWMISLILAVNLFIIIYLLHTLRTKKLGDVETLPPPKS